MTRNDEESDLSACICCNGELQEIGRARQLASRAGLLIAADGGARFLAAMDLTPHAIIGDMDSLGQDPWTGDQNIQRVTFPKDKDRSDTELAVEWAFEQGATQVLLLGAWGGRIDHSLGNSALLLQHPGRVALWNNGVLTQAVVAGQCVSFQTSPNALVSLIPFAKNTLVRTTGLEFARNDEPLKYATHGLSNVSISEVCSIMVNRGQVILCVEGQKNMVGKLTNSAGSLFDFGPMANEYESWYETPEGQKCDLIQKQDVRKFLPPVRDFTKLLDVGCGTGHWSGFFWSLGYAVHGIDISEKMTLVAQKTVPECVFNVANACALPFPDASFDIVVSMAALEFIPDALAAVQEMARCTRSGGIMLIGTLNRLAPINRDRLQKGEEPYVSGNLFSPDELEDLISPWGETRIVASSQMNEAPGPMALETDHRSVSPGSLMGPFIVAEVRRA